MTAGLERIAELEAENAALRAELAAIRRRRSAYVGRRESAVTLGAWKPFAEAGPVRDHIRGVMDATGITTDLYARLAGVEWLTVDRALSGRKIRTATAAKLLAVTAGTVQVPGDVRVDAAGTRHRLQALAVAGWSLRETARRSGVDDRLLSLIREGRKTRVAAKTKSAVASVYEAMLADEPPCATREQKTAAGRSRSAASRNGWVSCWAWDDDTIDDPAATPAEGWKRGPEGKNRRSADLAADTADLARFGLGLDRAAERLGVTRGALDKALARSAASA